MSKGKLIATGEEERFRAHEAGARLATWTTSASTRKPRQGLAQGEPFLTRRPNPALVFRLRNRYGRYLIHLGGSDD